MATRPKVDEGMNLTLEILEANVNDLPEVAEEWTELADGERVSWSLDWDQLMLSYLPDMHLAYRTGRMTPEQQERYRELLGKLRDALPILERLNLAQPPVPLNVTPARSRRSA